MSLLISNLAYPAIQISDPINPRREQLAMPAKIVSPLTNTPGIIQNWRHWEEELEENPKCLMQWARRNWLKKNPKCVRQWAGSGHALTHLN